MIYGPCDRRCINEGQCSKHFPREFREETIMSPDGYPYYNRRNDGIKIMRRKQTVDNRFGEPYCPGLLRIFNYHINVEIVSSLSP